jgi:hypothetical protein
MGIGEGSDYVASITTGLIVYGLVCVWIGYFLHTRIRLWLRELLGLDAGRSER